MSTRIRSFRLLSLAIACACWWSLQGKGNDGGLSGGGDAPYGSDTLPSWVHDAKIIAVATAVGPVKAMSDYSTYKVTLGKSYRGSKPGDSIDLDISRFTSANVEKALIGMTAFLSCGKQGYSKDPSHCTLRGLLDTTDAANEDALVSYLNADTKAKQLEWAKAYFRKPGRFQRSAIYVMENQINVVDADAVLIEQLAAVIQEGPPTRVKSQAIYLLGRGRSSSVRKALKAIAENRALNPVLREDAVAAVSWERDRDDLLEEWSRGEHGADALLKREATEAYERHHPKQASKEQLDELRRDLASASPSTRRKALSAVRSYAYSAELLEVVTEALLAPVAAERKEQSATYRRWLIEIIGRYAKPKAVETLERIALAPGELEATRLEAVMGIARSQRVECVAAAKAALTKIGRDADSERVRGLASALIER